MHVYVQTFMSGAAGGVTEMAAKQETAVWNAANICLHENTGYFNVTWGHLAAVDVST